ncbi:MAG: DUF1269 domain-containing protein [Patescibacteria group bacterium]
MTTITSGVFPNKAKAEEVINQLRDINISDKDISCVYKDHEGDVKDSQTGEKVGGGAVAGATTGAVLGTIAGLVVANGILPGLGTLFVAGPLATALGLSGAAATTVAGAATGAAAGGLIGGLSQLGVSDEDAKLYENHVRRGGVLVVSRADDASAMDIFMENGAEEVRQYQK